MRSTWIALVALGLSACAADVGEGKVTAEVADVPAAAEAPSAGEGAELPAGAKALQVDTTRSKLGAIGAKITAQHPIAFPDFAATVALSGEEVVSVSYEAQIATLTTDSPRLQSHLLKPDFLDAAAHPLATFRSVSVTKGSEVAGMTHTIAGDLTIRGKTRRVTFPALVEVGADAVKARTEFVIDRRDFDVVYPGKPDDLVQDNVLLQVDLLAPRA